MKISDKEVKAALTAWWRPVTINGRPGGEPAYVTDMRAALEAAYAVRKARKAKKRAKAKPSSIHALLEKALGKSEQPERQFGIGEWLTHGGGKAIIFLDDGPTGRELYGVAPNGAAAQWPKSGVYDTSPCTVHDFDLISPWKAPAKPEWNGKFEVGKSYRTRDGRKATITERVDSLRYCLRGTLPNQITGWTDAGLFSDGEQTPADLIGPWED